MTLPAADAGSAATLESRIEYAKLLLEHSRDSEAAFILKGVLDEAPDLSEVRLLMAQALTGCNRSDEAAIHLQKACDDPQTAAMANGMLGYWFQGRGRFAESRQRFERSIEQNPHQSLAYYGWIQSNRLRPEDIGILEKARSVSESPEISGEDCLYLLYVLGKGYADLGDYERSILYYDQANKSAFEQLLGGKPFNRGKYAEMIDSTIAIFTKAFFQRHRGVGTSNRKPIFVVGMMRSGTTLVEQILSSNPSVGAAGEVDFWLDEGSSVFDSQKRTVNLKTVPLAISQYLSILESLSPGTSFVTDKMPQNFQMLGLIHLAFPKAPIIHIRRNPVDTCLSIYTTAYQESPAFAHDRESIVFAYKQYLRLVAHWRKVLPPERFLEVDYETLTENPEPTIRKMVSFCGLTWDDACLRPEQNDRLVTTPSLWQVRQPVYRTAVERWKVFEPWLGSFSQLLAQPTG